MFLDSKSVTELGQKFICIAVAALTAESSDDLSLKIGDSIEVDEAYRSTDYAWWRGRNTVDGRVGQFPKSYVEEIGAAIFICTAIESFAVEADDDLALAVGDLVQVEAVYKNQEGWWRGKNLRDGRVGNFPSSYVEVRV
jgi:hypothetical protein